MSQRERIHIVFVSDSKEDIQFLETMLSKATDTRGEFRLDCVHSIKDHIGHNGHRHVDVVLLDMSLEKSGGVEGLKRVQEAIPGVPIVAYTSDSDVKQSVKIIESGAQDYLVKGHINHFIFTRTMLHAIERFKVQSDYQRMAEELKHAHEKLERCSYVDELTGLLNRRGLQGALSREIQRSRNDGSQLLAVLMDLDDFKHVNDTLGHGVGDVVLKEIGQKITLSMRLTDYVARVGGDEFLVLVPQTRIAEGVRVADKIRRAICNVQTPLALEYTTSITASLGIVAVGADTLSVDELLAKAHLVLRESKSNGKNRVSVEVDGFGSEQIQQSQLANILQALKDGSNYRAVKQPIMSLADGKLVGYEFLSRFSVEGLESPDDFFRVCLENHILTLVDRSCLRNCVNAGQEIPEGYVQHINLFPSTLIDIPVADLIQIFGQDVPKGKYCVEISEQQIIGDPSYLVEAVTQFKKMGIGIAIDDVGFGRSCLESLILLEPHIVKIDKKWIKDIAKTEWRQRSLKRLIRVARSLGAEIIAEGIESKEDMDALISFGVRYGQGYYLGRPA